MKEDMYRKLQQQLDTYSLGFPATESGVEIKILKMLFTDKDAGLFLSLTPLLETAEQIAGRIEQPIDETAAHLEDMAQRGLLFRLKKAGSVKYGAIPFIHGLFEFQVKHLGKDLAGLMEQYYHDGLEKSIQKGADLFLRVVPVDQSIQVEHHVASFEDARAILSQVETIVVTDCICRTQKELIDESCGKPLEVCFMFGSMAKFYLDNGMGREVTTEEAYSILLKAQEAGLVTQPSTSQNPNGMCSCCGDCCGILASIKSHPRPAEIVFSNHQAVIDAGLCAGCEACIERCQMDAIAMNDDGAAVVDLVRCIGCGLCVPSCAVEAVSLVPKEHDQIRMPPANAAEQMMTMAKKRGVI